jgi:hypothetical protein
MPTPTFTDPGARHRSYRLRVIDSCLPALAGDDGTAYTADVAHPEDDARTLVRLLLGFPVPAGAHGPWRCAIAGGQRTVWLEPVQPSAGR